MGVLFAIPATASGEAAYDTMTLTTGSGQAQAWNGTGVTYTTANTNNVFAKKESLDFTTATALRVTGEIDASGMAFTGNAIFGVCGVSLPSAAVNTIRIGVAYQYTLTGNVHRLLFQSVTDGGSGSNSSSIITPGLHRFDFRLQKASTDMASDGRADYYVDDALVASRTGMDIYDDFEDLAWLEIGCSGKISGLDLAGTGPFVLQRIGINDTGEEITAPFEPAYWAQIHPLCHSLGAHF